MLGGAALIMFATVAIVGIQTLTSVDFTDHRNLITIRGTLADGTYMVTSTNKATGAPSATDGKFTTILRRQPDGTWLIYRDVTNTNN